MRNQPAHDGFGFRDLFDVLDLPFLDIVEFPLPVTLVLIAIFLLWWLLTGSRQEVIR